MNSLFKALLVMVISSSAMASPAPSVTKELDVNIKVRESIYLKNSSADVNFQKYTQKQMKADMNILIYWTLYKGLNVEYQCTNGSQKAGKDMCSRITLEFDTMNPSYPDKLILSPSKTSMFVPCRSRFLKDKWEVVAYLNLDGLDGGDIKATGQLIISATV